MTSSTVTGRSWDQDEIGRLVARMSLEQKVAPFGIGALVHNEGISGFPERRDGARRDRRVTGEPGSIPTRASAQLGGTGPAASPQTAILH